MSAARPAGRAALRLLGPAETVPQIAVDRAAEPPTALTTPAGTPAVSTTSTVPTTSTPAAAPMSARRARAISPLPPDLVPRARQSCRCGHQREAHRHYRNGTDCGTCGCERFSAVPGRLGRLADLVLRRRPEASDRP